MSKSLLFLRALFGGGFFLILAWSPARAADSNAAKRSAPGALKSGEGRCFVRLDNGGPVLGVPEEFWNSPACGAAAQPVTEEWVSFDIQYPEMTSGVWPGAMERYLAHDVGPGKSMGSFQARIVWLFFSDDIPHTVTDRWYGPEPQVWQLIERGKKLAQYDNPYPVPIIDDSEIKGLRRIRLNDPLPPPPGVLKKLKAQGWVQAKNEGGLIEPIGADYELSAGCDQEFECMGSVRLKASRIQYRFIIPLRAKLKMADFIESMNSLVRLWIRK